MKKTILALILLVLSNVAVADNYVDSVHNDRICHDQGENAARLFRIKSMNTKEFFMNLTTSREYHDPKIKEMDIFATNYVFDKAVDEKDAHMTAWANCMDMLK